MNKKIFAVLITAALVAGISGQASAHYDYTVQKGDSLWKIAQQEKVSVNYLKEWNHLVDDRIFPNQIIRVEEGPIHTIVKGDTLSQIGSAHDVTVNDLMEWNRLSSDLIFPGQVLQTIPQNFYTVKSGDNLSKIAATHGIDLANLMRWNDLNTSLIHPGDVLIIQQGKEAEEGIEMTVEATAYTAYCAGCSGVTYTGIDLRANPDLKVISVDPTIIPLGSRVWVEGYGEAIAGDVGSAIKGNKIDVFIPEKADALRWGRKTVQIKILPDAK